jgi:hypothetical protein
LEECSCSCFALGQTHSVRSTNINTFAFSRSVLVGSLSTDSLTLPGERSASAKPSPREQLRDSPASSLAISPSRLDRPLSHLLALAISPSRLDRPFSHLFAVGCPLGSTVLLGSTVPSSLCGRNPLLARRHSAVGFSLGSTVLSRVSAPHRAPGASLVAALVPPRSALSSSLIIFSVLPTARRESSFVQLLCRHVARYQSSSGPCSGHRRPAALSGTPCRFHHLSRSSSR